MSTIYAVVGMHRSGTSLVSSMLQAVGIPMGCGDCARSDETQPFGYYEDIDFKTINRAILHGAKGNWHAPPSVKAIRRSANRQRDSMFGLIEERSATLDVWGWKDPRTSLTARVWLQVMLDLGHSPRIVLTRRSETGVIQSLLRRNGKDLETWALLYQLYQNRLSSFEHALTRLHSPYITVSFRELVSRDTAQAVTQLAQFIGYEDSVDVMINQVRRRG